MKKPTTHKSMAGQHSPNSNTKQLTRLRKKTKVGNILLVLFLGRSLNRFEAESLGDHCLHSTISCLSNEYGLKIDRKTEPVPNRFSEKLTSVKRYWLSQNSQQAALKLLESWGYV